MSPTAEIANWCEGVLRAAGVVKVLDLGCGTGGISSRLASADFDVVGVDQSAWRIALAKRKNASVQYVRADFFEFCPSHRFDAIIVSRVLHMLSMPQRQRLLSACTRWLNPGGTICAVDAQESSRLVSVEELLIGLVDPLHYANYRAFVSSGGLRVATRGAGWWQFSEGQMQYGNIGLAYRLRA